MYFSLFIAVTFSASSEPPSRERNAASVIGERFLRARNRRPAVNMYDYIAIGRDVYASR
jgi:hypothetical protein